jgi:hypothetical protein
VSHFVGVTRERVFSPGRVEDDAAILDGVAAILRERGHDVDVLDSDSERSPWPRREALVFVMCQGPRALARLREWQQTGVRIINSPAAILNCQRHRTIPLLQRAGVGLPASVLIDTGDPAPLPDWLDEAGAWLKRGDVHATETDDVVYVADTEAVLRSLRRFGDRGIARVVVQRHIPGMVLKFYAVRGSFFHCVQETPAAVLTELDRVGQLAASRLGVEIYGGDCVYGQDGALSLIDLNDWPSYRPCRASAATAIADYLEAQKVAIRQ